MQQSRNGNDNPRIALEQVEEVLSGSGERGDALRAEGFGTLVNVKRAKLVQARRERARLAVRYGEQSDQVARLDRQMALEHTMMVNGRAERDRLKAPHLAREEGVWQVHGYLRDQDGHPRAGYTVGLFPDNEGRQPALVSGSSNGEGYFHLRWSPKGEELAVAAGAPQSELTLLDGSDTGGTAAAQPASSGQPAGDAGAERLGSGLRINSNLGAGGFQARRLVAALENPVYLGARGPGQKAPSMDSRALHPTAGAIAYRDLTVLNDKDTGEQCHFATRLLGNSATRELHTLDHEKPGCHLAAIRPDHRVYFLSEAQAEKLGYDYCAYCFGKARSQR